MRQKLTSTADIIEYGRALLDGANRNANDMAKFGLDPKELQAVLGRYEQQESAQEKARADMHDISARQRDTKKELKAQYSKWTPVLEGHYGRNRAKLEEFGIAPRQSNPHRGPRKAKNGAAPDNGQNGAENGQNGQADALNGQDNGHGIGQTNGQQVPAA